MKVKAIRIPILLLSAAWLAAPAATASTHVSRCTTADGGSTYTDGSCRALGGKPAPMSANLMRSLAREGALGGNEDFRPQVGATPAAAPGAGNRHRLGEASCARTPRELAGALKRSLGDGEVNRLASLYDWGGMGKRQAQAVLDRLEDLSESPLIDGQFFPTGDGGTVQIVQGARAAPTVTEIPVNRRAGCLLLAL
jgi:hypothetical protein